MNNTYLVDFLSFIAEKLHSSQIEYWTLLDKTADPPIPPLCLVKGWPWGGYLVNYPDMMHDCNVSMEFYCNKS